MGRMLSRPRTANRVLFTVLVVSQWTDRAARPARRLIGGLDGGPVAFSAVSAEIVLPELALVVLVGPAGAGKSTFARAHFKPTEVISSDFCRALVADDERDQTATAAAFQILHLIAELRLRRRRLTVIDAVNSRPEDRRPFLELARDQDCAAVALVFDVS